MIKIMKDQWNKKQNLLRVELEKKSLNELQQLSYKDLVTLAFRFAYNEGNGWYYNVNIARITEIDDGNYQGTLIYIIPFRCYQPSESDYLMSFINYGSCTVCDTLQSIQHQNNKDLIINDLMKLSLDIFANVIKPYNIGWRYNNLFDVVEVE